MKTRLLAAAGCMGLIAGSQATAQDRTVLPIPEAPFQGQIAEHVTDSTPDFRQPVRAPEGAPNVLLFMSDDVGFAMSSAFGGPVPTPNFERLARAGQRYNRFHSTGICSPSRAALLTGRNHHNAGNGYLSDMQLGYPGYRGEISRQTATIAEILRHNGFNTAMFGKHHNTPGNFRSEAGPFDSWPTGLGFDYFYGFPYGDSDQFSPLMYRGIHRANPDEGEGKMVDERLTDDLIRWVHNQKAGAPDKPFLVYLAPGSTHAPHQVPKEYIARFKGKFDQGWDQQRVETWRRQIAMGIVPANTKLTPRPEGIPAWDSLSKEEQAYHARAMEVAAAQLAFQDEQFGRILDELDRMGELENTLTAVVLGDNGASGEAGPKGTLNELRTMGLHDERKEFLLANIDEQGGPMTYQNYSVGWAWAMDAPLRWTKQFASMLGGIRNGAIVSWPGHVAKSGSICSEFGHLVDIVPTVLEATNVPAPKMVLGAEQKPMDGKSLIASLSNCQPDKPRTQYFEIGGKVGLWHDGWFLSGEDGRPSWENIPPGGERPEIQWTLYDLSKDFSQAVDVSAQHPEKLKEMIALWKSEAEANDVLPLDNVFASSRAQRLHRASDRKRYDFWGKDVSVPANYNPMLIGRSFTVDAKLELDKADASGAVLALGSRFGGWSLYLDQGRPSFVFAKSTDPQEIWQVRSEESLPAGATTLRLRFATERPGGPANVTLSSEGREFAKLALPTSIVLPAGGGETTDVGRDLGVPVTEYRTPHGNIEGDVPHVQIEFD